MKERNPRDKEAKKIINIKFGGGEIKKAIKPRIEERNKNQKIPAKSAIAIYSLSSKGKFA